ncbi:MAG: FAD-dependent oxidoreductase [Rhodobacteraceae bacterium]|nr:FAD-dependent oxidoreductase [Paracoccaceae bacterium]
MEPLKIAVIGSGISGLSAAWLLSKNHTVTVYEAGDHLGGHANTLEVDTVEGSVAVDTGFIVYNERNYPNLAALFRHLDVDTDPTIMSFALSFNQGAYEYSGSGIGGFFGQKRNFFKPLHWQLLNDLSRFFRTASARVETLPADITLGNFLELEGYSSVFINDHIVPMGAAIWSTSMNEMLGFSARSFVDFYANHGMLQFKDRPAWRTVSGGSQSYVKKMIADTDIEVQLGNGVQRIVRQPGYVHVTDEQGVVRPFDHVVIATHANQALDMIEAPDPLEQDVLGAFSYQANRAVLHRDPRWMPKRKGLWSSWNYLKTSKGEDTELCVTYWMNRLQVLPTTTDLFVTLNPQAEIHPKAVDADIMYQHPVFDHAAVRAQKRLWNLQGTHRTWFCGSYFGYGFHEDGIQSGLAVAEALGAARRPWQLDNESGRMACAMDIGREAAE